MSDPQLGVVIVTFNSGSDAVDCIETLLASARAADLALRVVVVDNASRDDTVARLAAWGNGDVPYAPPPDMPFETPPLRKPLSFRIGVPGDATTAETEVLLIRSGSNLGFAGGVNVGLESLAQFPQIAHFWILNPDAVVPPEAARALAATLRDAPAYGLMGGRVTYMHKPDRIQIDGGTIDWRTGATGNLNLGKSHAATPFPAPDAMDFVMGGNMIASRAFLDRAGPMEEGYFLYYEEADWAMRRGTLPLTVCEGLRLYHHAGSSIGSPGGGTGASPLSLYFKHRGRMMFLRRFRPWALPTGAFYTFGVVGRLAMRRDWPGLIATLAGGFGFPPPRKVADRLGPAAKARLQRPARRRAQVG